MSMQAEKDSFNYQSKFFNDTKQPATLPQAVQRLEGILPGYRWSLPVDFLTDTHKRRTVERVVTTHPNKSSGAEFARQGLTRIRDVADRLTVDGLVDLLDERVKEYLTSADPRYVSRPLRGFGKREAHKAAKAADKRWRLIWGVDLIDRLVDELLYHEMLETALLASESGPLKPGFGFLRGGTHRMVMRYSREMFKKWQSFDSKMHDMTTPGWGLSAVRDLNERLCNSSGSGFEEWKKLSAARELSVLYGSLAFSDGTVLRKTKPGVQPSGRLTTIDSNSKLVVLYRLLWDVERQLPSDPDENVAMGDDTVLGNLGDPAPFLQFLKGYGITWTVESEPGPFAAQNFCSIEFKKLESGVYVPIPLNWDKNLFNLLHPEAGPDVSVQTLSSLCILYAFVPEKLARLRGALAKLDGAALRSEAYYKQIVTGYEGAGNEACHRLASAAEALLCSV